MRYLILSDIHSNLEALEAVLRAAAAQKYDEVLVLGDLVGYQCPEPRAEFYALMDAANIDLKGFTEAFYRRLCAGSLQPVLETLKYIHSETRTWLEITTLLIPGENDDPRELDALSRWVAENLGPDVPLHFTAFHPDWRLLDRTATPARSLLEARRIARENGLRHVYVGNVLREAEAATYCHGCGRTLIGRLGYDLTAWNLGPDGACLSCGTVCPGVFESGPGHWGGRRIRIPAVL